MSAGGRVRGLAVMTVVASGYLGLSLVSRPAAMAAGLGMALTLGAFALRGAAARLPWPLLTLSVVVGLGSLVAFGLPAASGLGVLLAYLQVHNRLGRLGESDDRTAVVLAALMLAIGASVSRDPLFGLGVAGFAAALPSALARGAPGLRSALGLGLGVTLLAAVLFVAAPRARLAQAPTELTGFSPEVELGALDELFDDPKVVFRAGVRPIPEEVIYWRGIALDRFDGTRWSSSSPRIPVTFQAGSPPPDALIIEVELREGDVLFTAGWPLDLRVSAPLLADGQGGYAVMGQADAYRLVAQGPLGRTGAPSTQKEADSAALERALALPPGLDPRIARLAAETAGQGSPSDKIERLTAMLRTSYRYTRRPRDAGSEAPLSVFLFERKAGHCEYFATALALMARAVGIPARVVNGFVGGTFEPETGWWSVRRSDAHTWVEYHDGGWVLADPTPGPAAVALPSEPTSELDLAREAALLWTEGVLGYDRHDQLEALMLAASSAERALVQGAAGGLRRGQLPWRGLLVLGLASLLVALGTRLLLRSLVRRLLDPPRAEPQGPVARAHHRARAHVAEGGWAIPPALPPVQAAAWLAERVEQQDPAGRDAARALQQLAWLYYAVHLGGEDPAPRAAEARSLLERVRTLRPLDAQRRSQAR